MSSEDSLRQSSPPTLCRGNCGFFGNPRTEGLCSKCFKESQKNSNTTTTNTTASSNTTPNTINPVSTSNSNSSSLSKDDSKVNLGSNQTPSAAILAITSPAGSTKTINPSSIESSPIATANQGNSTITLGPITNSPILSALPPPAQSNNNTNTAMNISPSCSPALLGVTGPNSTQSSPSLSPSLSPNASPSLSPNKAPKKRCTICKKKVGMDYFTCKCDSDALFCSAHRLPHNHNCSYDHKKDQKAKVEKQNPIVKNAQFEKI